MGYSWSSAVAQDVSLGLLRSAGFDEEQVICVRERPPFSQDEFLFVLTDDCIMAHTHAFSPEEAATRVGRLDASMRFWGVQQKPAKDVTASDTLTGMGCSLTGDPPQARPDATSIARCVLAVWALESVTRATPAAFSSLLGTCQWFALLKMQFFSIFRAVYVFARLEPLDVLALIPSKARDELCLFAALAPLLVADLAKDFIPLITASDAAPEYGFGLAVAGSDQATLRELSCLAEKRGDYVRFNRDADPDAEPERPRLGRAQRLAIRRCDFKHVLSLKARKLEHSGVLELQGALVLFKWLARSQKWHGRRALVLLDAKAVLFAIQKGRSSSRKLGRLLQRLGAYVIATDIDPRLLYVPAEDMPADEPSRGIRR